MKPIIILIAFLFSQLAFSAEEVKDETTKEAVKSVNVKYKESGRIDFESLLIEGERKKPELSVVTGNIGEKDTGLMVYRKDFDDTMANDFGEVIE
jgi:hypothetical protein